jgi:hypothetical protein
VTSHDRGACLAEAAALEAAGDRRAADRRYHEAGGFPIRIVLPSGADGYRFARSPEGIPHLRPGGWIPAGPAWLVIDAAGRALFAEEADARAWWDAVRGTKWER